MQAVPSDWTHVLVGSWNVAILNPQWIGQKVFAGNGPLQVELSVGGPAPSLRYHFQDISIIPAPTQLIVATRNATEAAVAQASSVASRILELLPVTPITGVGINFGFVAENIEPDIAAIFSLDSADFADAGLEVTKTTIVREIP